VGVLFDFYNIRMLMVLGIVIVIMASRKKFVINKYFLNSFFLEIMWSFFPLIILFILGVPSLMFLYDTERVNFKDCIKVVGQQWYWTYGGQDFRLCPPKLFRLIRLEEEVFVISDITYSINVSRSDVLHS